MDRFKAWAGNLFWGIAGNALYSWLTGGAVLAVVAAVLAGIKAIAPIWRDRALAALVALGIVMIGSALQTLIKRLSRQREPPKVPDTAVLPIKGTPVSKKWIYTPLQEVYRRTFRNERCPLDGMYYIDCVFDEGTDFHWNGEAPFKMVNPQPTAKWTWKFTTDNVMLQMFIQFLMDTKQVGGDLEHKPPL